MEKGRACPEFDSDLNLFRDEGDNPGEGDLFISLPLSLILSRKGRGERKARGKGREKSKGRGEREKQGERRERKARREEVEKQGEREGKKSYPTRGNG
jgi:hypothetical protein